MPSKEAKARIKINKLLEQSGWRFFDDENGESNIQLENNVKITKKLFNEFGEDFEKTTSGYIDFLLLDEKGFPLVVLEAKKESLDPLYAKEQARKPCTLMLRYRVKTQSLREIICHQDTPIRSYFPTGQAKARSKGSESCNRLLKSFLVWEWLFVEGS